jgi:hypothetical protein
MRFLTRALVASALALGSTAAVVAPASAGQEHHRPDGDRLRPAVTVHTADYDFELVQPLRPDGQPASPISYVRRTDDVGSEPSSEPDAHGFVQMSDWGVQADKACVTSGGGSFSFPDASDHAFTYGVSGRSVRRVVVVMQDGTRRSTQTTRVQANGFRGWMLERPAGQIQRIDGFDAHGRRVASFTPFFPDFTDFGQADTCEAFPFP